MVLRVQQLFVSHRGHAFLKSRVGLAVGLIVSPSFYMQNFLMRILLKDRQNNLSFWWFLCKTTAHIKTTCGIQECFWFLTVLDLSWNDAESTGTCNAFLNFLRENEVPFYILGVILHIVRFPWALLWGDGLVLLQLSLLLLFQDLCWNSCY